MFKHISFNAHASDKAFNTCSYYYYFKNMEKQEHKDFTGSSSKAAKRSELKKEFSFLKYQVKAL